MRATSIDVVLPFNSLKRLTRLRGVRVRRSEFQHELMVVETLGYVGLDLGVRTNDPIQATLSGVDSTPLTFVGYVNDIVETKSAVDNPVPYHVITCVGPTFRMKQQQQRCWRNVTITEVARKILGEYKLTADVEDSGVRIPMLNQTGESDWSFLCRIAKDFGYVVYPTATTVHIHSRTYNLPAKSRSARVLNYRPPGTSGQTDVYSFAPKIGDTDKSARIAQADDPASSNLWAYQDSGVPILPTRRSAAPPLFTRYEPIVAATPAELQARVKGAATTAMWTYEASGTVRGFSSAAPTDVVYLDGLQGGYDGYWTIRSVEHRFDQRLFYTMDVTLGTNSLGPQEDGSKPGTLPLSGGSGLTQPQRIPTSSSVLSFPTGSRLVEVSRERGGPSSISWRGSVANLDPRPAELRVPAFIRSRWRARG